MYKKLRSSLLSTHINTWMLKCVSLTGPPKQASVKYTLHDLIMKRGKKNLCALTCRHVTVRAMRPRGIKWPEYERNEVYWTIVAESFRILMCRRLSLSRHKTTSTCNAILINWFFTFEAKLCCWQRKNVQICIKVYCLIMAFSLYPFKAPENSLIFFLFFSKVKQTGKSVMSSF